MTETWQISPEINYFKATARQKEAFDDRTPILLLHGPAGSGKSHIAALKIHTYMKYYPGAMGLVLRKNRSSMINSVILFLDREIIGDDPDVIHYPSKKRFEYSNGSVLAYGGMNDEKQRQQIRSIGQKGAVDIVWMEEANAFSESDFNEIPGRMRGTAAPWRQIILSTNPDSYLHWINQRLILGGGAKSIYFPTEDNPAIDDEYIEGLRNLTGIARVRLYEGKWQQAEGLVYPEFDYRVHVKWNFEIPAHWRRFGAIDFGHTHPFVFLWLALSDDDELYVYRQIYRTKANINNMGRLINRINNDNDEQLEYIVADHDAGDRAILSEQYGIVTIKAKKDISTGVQLFANRLVRNQHTQRPRFFIIGDSLAHPPDPALVKAHSPTCMEEEFGRYIWVHADDGSIKTEIPLDKDNHGLDAGRYIVMALDGSRLGAQPVFPSDIYLDQAVALGIDRRLTSRGVLI